MNAYLIGLIVMGACITGCIGDTEVVDGTNGVDGTECADVLASDPARSVTIRVVNHRAVELFLADTCNLEPDVDGIFIDGESLERTLAGLCEEPLAGVCNTAMGCEGPDVVHVPPGATLEVRWDGRLAGESIAVPESCRAAGCASEESCRPLDAVADGIHEAMVQLVGDGDREEISITFEMPTDLVVIDVR